MILTGLPPPASLAKMEKRYPVDWKFTQVHPVLIALGRELGGRRLHPSLLRGFESRTDIIADHVSSIRHIRGEDLGLPIPMKPPLCSEMIAPPVSGMISPPV
ncbi:hypothetical protein CN090_33615 [Sinorhizobium meliloti]|uniref:hypothetical protein n=1 Tax=Rhizobium meliloti TaxID=382 RepID=UPI000FD3FAD1|nr:hypothetical protein [Sinorhizobium meliloti]RVN55450.1 hypothetical protein CN104_29945 [Sinorhizobium meliloti]RVO18034.1 hypothetical protein CN100_31210 [Sinorhizobium meliloti]RVO40796.1 hypothetical protein CN090_33615 [Sinorhizobium meliloti]